MAARLDSEGLAFELGMKRGLRIDVPGGERSRIEARLARPGVFVTPSLRPAHLGARVVDILYVARTEEDAVALRDAEAAVLPGAEPAPPAVAAAAHKRLGELLGYPTCCVEAFCNRLSRVTMRPAQGEVWRSEDYVSAVDAWVPRPLAALNNILRRTHSTLVTFYPCRYDCAVAQAFATTLLDGVRARHGAAFAQDVLVGLSRLVVVDPSDARAVVELDRDGAIARAAAPASTAGDIAFAASLVGRTAGERGALGTPQRSSAIQVDFSGDGANSLPSWA